MVLSFAKLSIIVFVVSFGIKWYVSGIVGRQIGQIFFLFPFTVAVFLLFIRKSMQKKANWPIHKLNLNRFENTHAVLFFLYLFIVIIGLLRAIGSTYELTILNIMGRIVTIVAITIFAYLVDDVFRNYELSIWKTVYIALTIYMLMNIVGLFLGFSPQFISGLGLDMVVDDAVLSFWGQRILFPFTSTPNLFSVEIGILVTMAIAYLLFSNHKIKRKMKIQNVLIALIGINVILASNCRSALVCAFSTCLIPYLKGKKQRAAYFIVFSGVLVAPIFFSYFNPDTFRALIPWDLSFLTRRGDIIELISFNNRTPIWRHAFDDFFNIELVHLFGFGAFGRITSGIVFRYAYSWQNPLFLSLHNGYVETLVDNGYIGLFILILLLGNGIRVLTTDRIVPSYNKHYFILKMVLFFLITINFFGPYLYHNNNLVFFVFCVVNIGIIRERSFSVLKNPPVAGAVVPVAWTIFRSN